MSRFRSFLHSVARPNIPWGNVLRGVTSANFWLSLVGMAILIVFLWCFDLIDDLYSRIAIVGLYSVIPASVLKPATGDGSKSRPFDWILFWFVLFLFAALLIAIGDRFDWAPLVINVAAVVTAFPLALASWLSIRKQLLLAVGLAGCGKRGSLLNCPVDGLRNTTMSGHNRSLGHDYIHILGDYYACRCPQDEVDRPQ